MANTSDGHTNGFHEYGVQFRNTIKRYMPKLANILELKDCFCWRYGMICCKSLLIRQSYHFTSYVAAFGKHSEHSV